MSIASRKLQVGAAVFTDFSGRITHHQISEIVCPANSQSGIGFYVTPRVPKSNGDWIDADWFEPANPATTHPSATARNEKD